METTARSNLPVTCENFKVKTPSPGMNAFKTLSIDEVVKEASAFLENVSNKQNNVKVEPHFDPSQIEDHEQLDDAIKAMEKFWHREKLSCLKELMEKAALTLKKPIYIHKDRDISMPHDQIIFTKELTNSCSIAFSSDVYQFIKRHQNGVLFMEYILKLELYKLTHSLSNRLAYGLSDHFENAICQQVYAHLFAVNRLTSPDLDNLKTTFYDFIQDESITEERREFCQKYYLILIFIRIFYDINQGIIEMDWIHLTAIHRFTLEDLYTTNAGYKQLVDLLKLTFLNMYIDQCVGDCETEKYLLNELLAVINSVCSKYQWPVGDSLTDEEIKIRLLSFCVYCYAYKVTKSMTIADSLGDIIKFVDHEYNQYYPISFTKMIISMLKDKWTNGIEKNAISQCTRWLSKLLKESHDKGLADAIIELVIHIVLRDHRLNVRSEVIKETLATLQSISNLGLYHKLWNQLEIRDQYYMLKHMVIPDVLDTQDVLVTNEKTLIDLRLEFKIQWCLSVIQHRHWSISNKAKAFVRVFTLFGNIWSDEFYRTIQHCPIDMVKDLLLKISELVHLEKEGVIDSYVLFLKDLAGHVSDNDNLLLLIVQVFSYLSNNSTTYQLIECIGPYLKHDWQDKRKVNLVFAYWTFAVVHISRLVIHNDSLSAMLTVADSMSREDKKAMILLAYYIAMRNQDQQLIEFIDQKYCIKHILQKYCNPNGFDGKKLHKKVAKWFDSSKQISSIESANVHENVSFQELQAFDEFILKFNRNVDQYGFYKACKYLLRK